MKKNEKAAQFLRVLQNWIAYYTNLVTPVPIGYVILGVTFTCNARCKMCNIWKIYQENPGLRAEELDAETIVKRIKNSSILKKVYTIDITGGEPFMRGDLAYILSELFSLKNIRLITINTNGFNTDKILKDTETILNIVPKDKVFSVSVSLDGVGDIHEKIRGVAGCFEKVVKTVKGLKELQKKFMNLELRSNAVIQKDNIDHLEDLEKFWKEYDISGSFDIIHDNRYTHTSGENSNIMKMRQDEIEKIKNIKRKSQGMNYYIDHNFLRMLHCFAGFSSMFIDAAGRVYPCNYLGSGDEYLMGEIKKEEIDAIWKSKKAKEVRKKIKKCTQIHCWNGCEVVQTLIQYNVIDVLLRKVSFNLLSLYKLKGLKDFS